MATPGNSYSTDDLLEPDSDDRAMAAAATAGALCNPEDVIPDYGWYNGDYSENQHANSREHTDMDSTDREYISYDKDAIDGK